MIGEKYTYNIVKKKRKSSIAVSIALSGDHGNSTCMPKAAETILSPAVVLRKTWKQLILLTEINFTNKN